MPRLLLSLLALAALGGCTAIGAVNRAAEPLDAFEVRAPDTAPEARTTQGIDFIVTEPSASGAIDTDRILVRPMPTQIQYLPDARWSEPAPMMVQTAMVETFLRANAFRFVGREPLGVSGDVALVTDLVDFGAEIRPGAEGAVVEMTLVARLVREEDAAVLASRSFSQSVVAPDTETPTLVAGFEAVTDAVLTDLARWVYRVRGVPVGPS